MVNDEVQNAQEAAAISAQVMYDLSQACTDRAPDPATPEGFAATEQSALYHTISTQMFIARVTLKLLADIRQVLVMQNNGSGELMNAHRDWAIKGAAAARSTEHLKSAAIREHEERMRRDAAVANFPHSGEDEV